MTDHPSFAGHPMLTHAFFDYKTKAVPIIIYGDGTPVTGISKGWSKSVDSLIWSSALANKGNTWIHNFIACFLYEVNMYVDEDGNRLTEDDIWREFVWSLYWLHEGVHPDRGSDNIKYTAGEAFSKKGQPLAGGYFGPTWVLTGDLEFMFKRLFFADYNKPSECCSLCGANNTDAPWTDCRDHLSVWIQKIHSNSSYALAKPNRHRLLRHVPGVGMCNYIPDTMHCKHLGPDKSFAGSTLRNLTHHILPGDPKNSLQTIWKDIVAEYKRQKTTTRFGIITANMIQGQRKLPELRGKAAQLRSLMPVLLRVWTARMDERNAQHRDIRDGLAASSEIDRILHEHRGLPRFPPAVRVKFRKACFTYMQSQAALINFYHPGTPLFNTAVKSHYILHLGLICEFINPSLGACWQGEDMMRVVRRLLQSCANGARPETAALNSMKKYCMALSFELDHCE